MEMILAAEGGEPGKVGGAILDLLNEEAGVMTMVSDNRWIVNVYMMNHKVEAVLDLEAVLNDIDTGNMFDAEEYLVLASLLEKHAKRLREAVQPEFRERAEETILAAYEATGKIHEFSEQSDD